MILLLGDIHGDYYILKNAIDKANEANAAAIIQLGDFGLFGFDNIAAQKFNEVTKRANMPVYFIDGNHDDCKRWVQVKEVTSVFENGNLFYVPRGTVMDIDGRTIAFMGGAGSIDKDTRLRHGWHWDEYENISPMELLKLMDNAKDKKIDMFLTHCPPNSVIQEHFDPRGKLQFGVGIDWHDHNQDIIENAWRALDYPPIYSGHMHKTVEGTTYTILNINQCMFV